MVMGGNVRMAHHVLPFKLDVHGPGVEIDLASVDTGNHTFLWGASGLVARALLEVGFVLKHHLLVAYHDRLATVGGVAGHPRVGIRDGNARRSGGGFFGGEKEHGGSGDRISPSPPSTEL